MLIPKYWAVYKQRFDKVDAKQIKRQATIKRYGWSNISQEDALRHAKQRVTEAHQRWQAGEDIHRLERKELYNTELGIPIREQILLEQSFIDPALSQGIKSSAKNTTQQVKESTQLDKAPTQLIVTRNSYGAQVANINNIAIIDVDNDDLMAWLHPAESLFHSFIGVSKPFGEQQAAAMAVQGPEQKSWSGKSKSTINWRLWVFILGSIVIASIIVWQSLSWSWLMGFMMGMTGIWWYGEHKRTQQLMANYQERVNKLPEVMHNLIEQRLANYPEERFRLYQTPEGFRIIATHATLLPNDEAVKAWFEHFHADSNYVRLCHVQQCFRARLTAKPWRMDEVMVSQQLDKTIPTTDFWLLETGSDGQDNCLVKAREEWIKQYETFAKNYRACQFLLELSGDKAALNDAGIGNHKAIEDFVRWHDTACQVTLALPLA